MSAPLLPLRNERGSTPRSPSAPGATGGTASDAGNDLTASQQDHIAVQHAAFDFEAAERAEMLREEEALESLVMEQLKNEDEIMKKWIALV